MAKSILSNNPGQLVTKAKVNVSDWTSYTPTTQGLGTVSNVDFKWRRVGDTLEVVGQLTSGTVTADEMQISLPDNLIISSKTTRFVGEWYREISQNTVYFHNVLATAGDSFVNFSLNSAINDGIGDDLANAVVPNSTNLFFKWRVPIAGWDSQAEFLAPQIQPKVAYLKDVKPVSTDAGGYTAGSWVTRDLNTVEGDSEIVSLSANRFTLQSGKYIIEAESTAFRTDVNLIKLVRDPAGSPTDEIIGNANYSSATADTHSSPKLMGTITLTGSTQFEIQFRGNASKAVNGLGTQHPFASNIYTQVKITKIS